jgi:hypothetical protein
MKLIVVVILFMALAGCTSAPPASVTPFPGHDFWLLNVDKNYEVGKSGIIVAIPAGFVTDYASIPRPLWTIASPQSDYSEAAIIHDYLYWTQSCTRLQADNIFLIAMKEDGVGRFKRWAVYRAVRGAGQGSWEENKRAANAGMPRWIPKTERALTSESRWPSTQEKLAASGVHDVLPEKNLPYCHLGDSAEIPIGIPTTMP